MTLVALMTLLTNFALIKVLEIEIIKKTFDYFHFLAGRGCGAVVEHSTHDHEIKGLDPAGAGFFSFYLSSPAFH